MFRDGFGGARAAAGGSTRTHIGSASASSRTRSRPRTTGRTARRCLPRADRAVPIDPKTGYKHEPWHLRFIGVEAAARYHAAWADSGPGTSGEITLEQWLRAQRGLAGDAELPVCDGCQCGACATMAGQGNKAPCGDASLLLDESGRVAAPSEEPPPSSWRRQGARADAGFWIVEMGVARPGAHADPDAGRRRRRPALYPRKRNVSSGLTREGRDRCPITITMTCPVPGASPSKQLSRACPSAGHGEHPSRRRRSRAPGTGPTWSYREKQATASSACRFPPRRASGD